MKRALLFAVFAAAAVIGVYALGTSSDETSYKVSTSAKKSVDLTGLSVATFAGGCFWCVEAAFEEVPGVREAISGYSGGEKANPTYKEVSGGLTTHTEAVQVYYDPTMITYEGLLQVLWRTADPTDSEGQFSDRGSQYRPAIFYHNEEEKRIALAAREELDKSGRYDNPVTIEIVPFKAFYEAEDYHQDYYTKNPVRYTLYTIGSGRAGFQEETWGNDLTVDFFTYRPVSDPPQKTDTKPGLSADM